MLLTRFMDLRVQQTVCHMKINSLHLIQNFGLVQKYKDLVYHSDLVVETMIFQQQVYPLVAKCHVFSFMIFPCNQVKFIINPCVPYLRTMAYRKNVQMVTPIFEITVTRYLQKKTLFPVQSTFALIIEVILLHYRKFLAAKTQPKKS